MEFTWRKLCEDNTARTEVSLENVAASSNIPLDVRPLEQPWIAVQLKPNHERAAAEHLSIRGHDCFLPLYRAQRRWSDRMKAIDLPLFPGYLFCRYIEGQRASILSACGVTRIVSCCGVPVPVSDSEIQAVRDIVDSGLSCQPHSYVRTGDRVRLLQGPLRGLEGIVIAQKDNQQQFVVSLTMLQRSVAVSVEPSWLSRLRSPTAAVC